MYSTFSYGTTMSGARLLKISPEVLSCDEPHAAIYRAKNIRVISRALRAAPRVAGKPIPCQANSEACSAISEGLAFLLYAM